MLPETKSGRQMISRCGEELSAQIIAAKLNAFNRYALLMLCAKL